MENTEPFVSVYSAVRTLKGASKLSAPSTLVEFLSFLRAHLCKPEPWKTYNLAHFHSPLILYHSPSLSLPTPLTISHATPFPQVQKEKRSVRSRALTVSQGT